jgi:hypothetical protein
MPFPFPLVSSGCISFADFIRPVCAEGVNGDQFLCPPKALQTPLNGSAIVVSNNINRDWNLFGHSFRHVRLIHHNTISKIQITKTQAPNLFLTDPGITPNNQIPIFKTHPINCVWILIIGIYLIIDIWCLEFVSVPSIFYQQPPPLPPR